MAIILAKLTFLSRKIMGGAIIIIFILLQMSSRNLTLKNHPLISRSRIVDENISFFLKKYPTLPLNSVIYVKNDPNYPFITDSWGGTAKQMYLAASGANSFKVYYEGVDKLPDEIETPKFMEITAKVPY